MFVCFFNISDHVKLKRKTLVNVFRFKHQCVVFKLHSTGATDVTSLLHLVLKILIDNYSRFFFFTVAVTSATKTVIKLQFT